MKDCKHCDAGLPVVTLMLGDVPVPGMHKVPCGGGNAEIQSCPRNPPQISQKALDDAARSPFWSMIKKESRE
jgi:hypothetical protein